MESKYLVSIAIPTYNHQMYAKRVVRQVYSLGKDIQIVISDNSTEDTLRDELKDIIDDNRVKLIYTPDKVSVVENYDIAASNCDGEYYCAIGDDDIVLESIIKVARWMKREKIDAVRSSRWAVYNWPDNNKGVVSLGPFTGKAKKVDTYQAVIDTLKYGCQSFMETDMIGTYHEIVKKSVLDRAKNICGHYYSGFSPDIYSATAISLLPDLNAMRIDYPITIPGMSNGSATQKARNKSIVSSVEAAIKKYGKEGYVWDSRVPYLYMPQTTWATTMLNAIEDMNCHSLIKKYYNKEYLINSCANYHGGIYETDLKKYLSDDEKKLLNKKIDTSFTGKERGWIERQFEKIKTVFYIARGTKYRKVGVFNSEDAARLANNFLNTDRMKKMINYMS